MKAFRALFHIAAISATFSLLLAHPAPVRAAGTTITVDTNDGGITDDGLCSFREALQAAATNTAIVEQTSVTVCPAGSAAEIDIIAFDLPLGSKNILFTTTPFISSPVFIDGSTDPAFAGTPVVRMDGGDLPQWGLFFQSSAANSTLKNVIVTRFQYAQIAINGANNVTLVGNYVGTDGNSDLGGNGGITIGNGTNVTVGGSTLADRNVIAGNLTDLEITSGTSNTHVLGNFIGVYPNGTTTPPGSNVGIVISGTASAGTGSGSNHIGGLGIGEGNVIAGHAVREIWIASDDQSFSDNNTIQGNIIGLNAAGTAAVSVIGGNGIDVMNSDNTLIEGNVVSGKNNAGIDVEYNPFYKSGAGTPAPPENTVIRSNKVGTSLDGMSALGNGTGIFISEATNTVIGGQGNFALANLVSGNGDGIEVEGGSGNVIDTNLVGLDNDRTGSIPNTSHGLYLGASVQVSRNWIANSPEGLFLTGSGGLVSSSNNCITGNTLYGVDNATGTGVTFTNSWWKTPTGPTHASNPSGTGDAVSDLVTFSPYLSAPPAACQFELLSNPGFLVDANNDKKPDSWTLKGFVKGVDKRDCKVHQGDSCSLKLVGNGLTKTASQTVFHSGIAGDDVSLSLWSKAVSVPIGGKYRVQVKFYNGTTLLKTITKSFPVGTHGFKRATAIYTAPGPYDKMIFTISLKEVSGTAWFDTASLNWSP